MTHGSTHDGRRTAAILSRLLVVLALLLFALPQGQAEGVATSAGPAAQSEAERAHSVVPVQRHLLRAQLPGPSSPDAVEPDAAAVVVHLSPAGILPAPHSSFLPIAIRILPPVRGPPAA